MLVIDNKFNMQDRVYLVTDNEQCERMITAIKIIPGDVLMYELSKETLATWHYDFEISTEKIPV